MINNGISIKSKSKMPCYPMYPGTVLPQIMAWPFISFQQIFNQDTKQHRILLSEENVMFIICDAINEF